MYLNLDPDFFDHPKTTRLVARLGRGAEVLPLRLWAYCGKFHGEDGRLTGYHDSEIEGIARWWGEQGRMLSVMAELGWIERADGHWCISNWTEHQGHIGALKERGKRMAEARWGRIRGPKTDADSIADGIATDMPRQCSNQPSTLPTNHHTLEVGGGLQGEGVEGGTSKGVESAGSGRFALPKVGGLPVPLFPATAGKMKAQCDEEIKRIKEASKKSAKIGVVGGERVRTGTVYEPEAQAAIDAWKRRKEEIERGLA